jgi:uncharacterized protein YkwD
MSSRHLGTLSLLALALVLAATGPSRAEHEAWQPIDVPDVALYPAQRLETAMLADLNAARQRVGEPRLELEPRLTALARAYARRMLTKHFIGHVSPDGSTPASRLHAAGYTYTRAAENLILTTGDEQQAFAGLDASPSHHANMFDARFTKVGIGAVVASVYATMYVQEFADE